jgi:hypothetical protein
MRPYLLRACQVLAITGGCLAGCKGTAPQPAYPNDPLLVSKKPVEGKLESKKPQAVVRAESTMPPLPIEALVARPAPDHSSPQARSAPASNPGSAGAGDSTLRANPPTPYQLANRTLP